MPRPEFGEIGLQVSAVGLRPQARAKLVSLGPEPPSRHAEDGRLPVAKAPYTMKGVEKYEQD